MAQNNDAMAALDRLDQAQGDLEDSLQNSPTAFSNNIDPSRQDVSTQLKLRQIENQRAQVLGKQINNAWYGTGKNEDTTQQDGGFSFSKLINGLSAPLYGIVGATEHILGKGAKKSLVEDINDNALNRHETFGNLLQKYGAPLPVSMPIGMMLDVAMDPVNWATAGTAAMLPRAAVGLKKAGLEGLESALKSSALEKTATVGRFIPGVSSSNFIKRAGEKAIEQKKVWNSLVGYDIFDEMAKKANRVTVPDRIKGVLSALPHGDQLIEQLEYSPRKWQRIKEMEDILLGKQKQAGKEVEGFRNFQGVQQGAAPEDIQMQLQKLSAGPESGIGDVAASQNLANNVKLSKDFPGAKQSMIDHADEMVSDARDIADNPSIGVSLDTDENAMRLAGENENDALMRDYVQQAISRDKKWASSVNPEEMIGNFETKLKNLDGTGVKWYDDFINKTKDYKIKDVNVGKKVLDTYGKFIAAFKLSKIGMNPSSYINSVVGNPSMYAMYGGDITDPTYFGSILNANKFIRGKGEKAFIDNFLGNKLVQDYMERYPRTYTSMAGMTPQATQLRGSASRLMDEEIQKAMRSPEYIENVRKIGEEEAKSLLQKQAQAIADNAVRKAAIENPESGYLLKMKNPEFEGTSLGANEIGTKVFMDFRDNLQKSADEGNWASKALLWAIDKPMEKYEMIDQSFKLGTFYKAVNHGFTEGELSKMSRITPITKDDIIDKYVQSGKEYYRIAPRKASEMANDMYMNYAAMPGAVKVLRSMPLLSSPFFAFTYGMATKTGQALKNNPSFFNKANYFLNEIQRNKSPLEKEALNSPMYAWYNKPGMVSIPFFRDNPVYINAAQALPWLTLNMFSPSERNYKSVLGSSLAGVADKTGIMGDPVGQTILDYFIIPTLIGDERAVGRFGQPLFPEGATKTEKAGYAARNVAEALTPGALGLAGPLAAAAGLPNSVIDKVPSYQFRKNAYAVQGKTPVGGQTKQNPWEKGVQSYMGNFGLALHPMDFNNLSSQINKNKK